MRLKLSLLAGVVRGLLPSGKAWPWQVVLLLWQLPQVVVGLSLALVRIVCGKVTRVERFRGAVYVIEEGRNDGRLSGMTLGPVVNMWLSGRVGDDFDHEVLHGKSGILRHEWGHTVDSRRWGPLYLLVVGLPSLVSVALDGKWSHQHAHTYTERWADRNAEKLRLG